jgi:hypothetical protein
LALAAFASKMKVAEQRDVVIEPDSRMTGWACGPWKNNRFFGWYAVYTHIEKAPNAKAENDDHPHQHVIYLLSQGLTGNAPLNGIP